jgi:hydroxyacylglutathione hydrolase
MSIARATSMLPLSFDAGRGTTITPLPLFADNYSYRVMNASGECAVVDPADAAAVLGAVPSQRLVGVLTTHHHADHSGGNLDVAAAVPGVPIIGGAAEDGKVPGATRLVQDGEVVELAGLRFAVLHTPCHTRGHVCYLLDCGDAPPCLFSGDTLFAAGCGRFFEGTAEIMHGSLARLAALPPETRVFCGHEYTIANLLFCLHVEPDNAATIARMEACKRLLSDGKPTVPSTIREELATNVFMRCSQASVVRWAAVGNDPVAVLARLREAKNAFKAPV